MSTLTPELEAEFDALKMQIRGWEVAKRVEQGWEEVKRLRPTELGRKQALRDLHWLQNRNPGVEYALRAVVSLEINFDMEQPEESAIVAPTQLEMSFPVPADESGQPRPDIPLNYAELANED